MEAETNLSTEEKSSATSDFLKLLQFATVSGSAPLDEIYDACAKWLMNSLIAIGLECVQILPESVPHKPIVVATWLRSDPSLPAILLKSHYDVVPVMEESWSVEAFTGLIKGSRIYGRGAQVHETLVLFYHFKCK